MTDSHPATSTSRLIDQIDERITLWRSTDNARFHLDKRCPTIPDWQAHTRAVQVNFSSLDSTNLCSRCTNNLSRIVELWVKCPSSSSGPPVVIAGREADSTLQLLAPVSQLLSRCAVALGAQFASDEQGNRRFIAMVPQQLSLWLSSWTPYEALICISPTDPRDTARALALALGLWTPTSAHDMLSNPITALSVAHRLTAPPLASPT